MRFSDQPRLPFAPIVAWCATGDAELAELLHCSRRVIQRRKHDGTVRLELAEQCADLLGVHPLRLWGDDYRRACALAEEREGPL